MPLSEHEQKLLEQMEQALAAEDPKFASQMQGSALALGSSARRWLIGASASSPDSGLVLVGVNTTMWVGAIGFAVMVAAVVFAAHPAPSRPSASASCVADGTARRPRAKGAARARRGQVVHGQLDERWRAPPEQLVTAVATTGSDSTIPTSAPSGLTGGSRRPCVRWR